MARQQRKSSPSTDGGIEPHRKPQIITRTRQRAARLQAEYAATTGKHILCIQHTASYGMESCWCMCSSCWSSQGLMTSRITGRCICKYCSCHAISANALFDLDMIARRSAAKSLFVYS